MNQSLKNKLKLLKTIKNNTQNNIIHNTNTIKKKPINLKGKKVALLFFGLTRSLRKTHILIKKNILDIFVQNKIDYKIFMHTYKLNFINSKRSNEKNVKQEFDEYKLLNPDFFDFDEQNEIIKKINVKKYRSKPDIYKTKYQNNDFIILAWYSKMKAIELLKKSGQKFDYVIFLRPDLDYIHKFPIQKLSLINKNSCLIPNFAHHSGVNDRFLVLNQQNAYNIGNGFNLLLIFSKTHILRSEYYLKYLLNKYNIIIHFFHFNFRRIRANLTVNKGDMRLK